MVILSDFISTWALGALSPSRAAFKSRSRQLNGNGHEDKLLGQWRISVRTCHKFGCLKQ